VLLGKGTPGMDVMTLAAKLARLIDEKGPGRKGRRPLAIRRCRECQGDLDPRGHRIRPAPHQAGRRQIITPADLLPHVRHYADRKQEHFLCASINGANEILNIRVVSIGLIDRSPVHPREVFADALADRASAVIVAHNHPSGGVEPSPSDIDITAQLKAAGEIVGIELLDHIIFNRIGYFSFLENGIL
jgi:DNA repair protein RadC